MLKAVATAILMHMQIRYILFGLFGVEAGDQINDTSYSLPTVFVSKPFPELQWLSSHLLDLFHVLLNEYKLLIDWGLILSHQVCHVDF